MPVSLAELTSDHAHVTVTYNGHEIDVEYVPSLVTEKSLAEMMDAAARVQQTASAGPDADGADGTTALTKIMDVTGALNHLIVRLVHRWDITENDGATMFPLDMERLAELPIVLRQRVVNAIFGDLRMDPTTGMQ